MLDRKLRSSITLDRSRSRTPASDDPSYTSIGYAALKEAYDVVGNDCLQHAAQEAIGALFTDASGVVARAEPMVNTHPAQGCCASVSRTSLIALAQMYPGLRLSGLYHSHPFGPPGLSAQDRGVLRDWDFMWVVGMRDGALGEVVSFHDVPPFGIRAQAVVRA